MSVILRLLKALDKSVAEATEQRKAENEEYKSTMASNTAAKDARLSECQNTRTCRAQTRRTMGLSRVSLWVRSDNFKVWNQHAILQAI
jgi:hypothetical protein